MLIVRAPVRISFAGGGTDLPDYYEKYGGAVISTTIDKYLYAFLSVSDGEDLQVTSSDYRTFYRHNGNELPLWDGDLSLPRAILNHFGISRGMKLFLASEVPPGTGLGSSSAVAVAVIRAVSTALGLRLKRHELAELACQIEIYKMGSPIGKQDHYAPAFGGLNLIRFERSGVKVEPLSLRPNILHNFEGSLLLFYTGAARNSSAILAEQKQSSAANSPTVIKALHSVKEMVQPVAECLDRGDLQTFGEMLNQNWEHKKRFAPGVTNALVDECYQVARSCGALGGKLTGAGGGGFLMLCCEPDRQDVVTAALEARGLKRLDFRFEQGGVRVLMNAICQFPLSVQCAT